MSVLNHQSKLSPEVLNSKLCKVIAQRGHLVHSIGQIRSIAEKLGGVIARLIPSYTDHSISHMDSLWGVCDQIFTDEEFEKFSVGEAYILGASFYMHDLGMSLGATKEGCDTLKESDAYAGYLSKYLNSKKIEEVLAHELALQAAARELHATNALDLATKKIPGVDMYLIEDTELRNNWARFIGEVSTSHHWTIQEVETKLGSRNIVPDPEGEGSIDLGFVACALRIIDYAHINAGRAGYLDRILRSSIDSDSLIHWKAQENIVGPKRDGDKIVYATKNPISDVEAWWLFYKMATGLHIEINSVSEYLSSRFISKERFSLVGVASIQNTQSFSHRVQPDNFEPVDIRFRPDSIERLVDILGGKSLYGNDMFAPLREMIQNSRDAIHLQKSIEEELGHESTIGKISVSFNMEGEDTFLKVSDNGVGMTSDIITNYLLGIASDYWNSQEYFSSFPNAHKHGFHPTGKFGIGFLSVFMFGDEIQVDTQRRNSAFLQLKIKGLGKYGAMYKKQSIISPGTTIKIKLSKVELSKFSTLDSIVRAKAPMLKVPIQVSNNGQSNIIESGWWRKVDQSEFFNFIQRWELNAFGLDDTFDPNDRLARYDFYRRNSAAQLNDVGVFDKWYGSQPEIISDKYRIIAIPGQGKILICSKGIAIQTLYQEGLMGIAEIDEIELNAARNTALKWELKSFRENILSEVREKIIESLDSLIQEGMITPRFAFLTRVIKVYGESVLIDTKLPWINLYQQPGISSLYSVQEINEILKEKDEVIIFFGANPWVVGIYARDFFPESKINTLVFPIPSINQPSFGDYSTNVKVTGSLDEHFSADKHEWHGAVLLNITLKVIASAWKVEMEKIIKYNWIRHQKDQLGCYLKRESLLK